MQYEKHVFQEDLSSCPQCGGPMRWREVATTPETIARLCAEHELSAEHTVVPSRRPVPRAPPKGQLVLRFGA